MFISQFFLAFKFPSHCAIMFISQFFLAFKFPSSNTDQLLVPMHSPGLCPYSFCLKYSLYHSLLGTPSQFIFQLFIHISS